MSAEEQRRSILGLLVGVIEATLACLEFLVGLSLVRGAVGHIVAAAVGEEDQSRLSGVPSLVVLVVSNAVLVWWMLFRFGAQVGMGPRQLALKGFGLGTVRVSRTALMVCGLHAVGFAACAGAQVMAGEWFFSLQNYYYPVASSAESRAVDLATVADMLVVAPWREELVFRGILFSIFYKRAKPRTGPGSAAVKARCALAAGAVFGAVHLLNSLGTRYSPPYIAIQVTLGFVIGACYSAQFVLAGTLWESVALHSANNFFSSFLPLDLGVDQLTRPLLLVPLLITLVVYCALLLRAWRELKAVGVAPFHAVDVEKPLQPSDSTPAKKSQ